MLFFKVFSLALLINIACSLSERGSGHGSTNQSELQNTSVVDYPVTLPIQILKELVDISDNSKGLRQLWFNSFYLTKLRLLTVKVRTSLRMRECILALIL